MELNEMVKRRESKTEVWDTTALRIQVEEEKSAKTTKTRSSQ